MSIREELQQFDGKHTDVLERVLSRQRPTNSFIRGLVILVADKEPKIQTAATWLLKQLAENDEVQFKAEHLMALFGSLSELTYWISKLHVCQMLQYVAIPRDSDRTVALFLERNLRDENKYLRAWSYNGFYELARQHEKYISYALEQLERGETDKAASVKARIRNIRKAMNKLPRKI
jgi:hypothetical protein